MKHRLLHPHTHFVSKILCGLLCLRWAEPETKGTYDETGPSPTNDPGRLKPPQRYEAHTQVHRRLQEERDGHPDPTKEVLGKVHSEEDVKEDPIPVELVRRGEEE